MMGEYTSIKGYGQIKLGTCEDWRYVRRDELELLAQHCDARSHEHNARSLRECANNPGLFFRFPLPWEDRDKCTIEELVGRIHGRDMFQEKDVRVPLFQVRAGAAIEWPHEHAWHHFSSPGGGYGVNVRVACPFSLEAANAQHASSPVPRLIVSAIGEKTTGTLFACIYCNTWVRLETEDIAKLEPASASASLVADRIIAAPTSPPAVDEFAAH